MSCLSKVSGMDASHNAGVAQSQANLYQGQAAPLYQGLAGQGSSNTGLYNSNIGNLLNEFAAYAGLPANVKGPQTIDMSANSNGVYTATRGNTASGGGKAPTSQPGGNTGQSNNASNLPPQVAAYAAQNSSFNPWQLDQNGQQYLASVIDQYNQQTTSMIQQFNSSMASSGINDSEANAAGAAMIRQQQSIALNAQVSQFMEQQQANKQQAAGSLLSTVLGIGNSGAQQTAQGAGGLASLGGAQQQTAIQQSQLANQQAAGVGSFLSTFIPGGSAYDAITHQGAYAPQGNNNNLTPLPAYDLGGSLG